MQVKKLFNVEVCKPKVFRDKRGYFLEIYNFYKWGVLPTFVQSNMSFSKAGTLRGLHFQEFPYEQAKYIHVVYGEIYDVVVDINNCSETFGHWESNVLRDNESILIGKQYAHGFFAIKDTLIVYNVSSVYNKEHEKTLLWSDPSLKINWPIKDKKKLLISDKDKRGTTFQDIQ